MVEVTFDIKVKKGEYLLSNIDELLKLAWVTTIFLLNFKLILKVNQFIYSSEPVNKQSILGFQIIRQ